jgi:hypothetical protein
MSKKKVSASGLIPVNIPSPPVTPKIHHNGAPLQRIRVNHSSAHGRVASKITRGNKRAR